MTSEFRNPDRIRADFSAAMSAMYKAEVPAYGRLIDIVSDVNNDILSSEPIGSAGGAEDTARISEERHGAIRLGTAAELRMMARVFAVMGMYPVGYYDLSVADVPVHSTAFRPISREGLAYNPFRVFTSLLRLELIDDAQLRRRATEILAGRNIFSGKAISLTQQAETDGGLTAQDADSFVSEILETFRWHGEAQVDADTFAQLLSSHRLIADVVSFKGPHINHLTPRTLNIDNAHHAMAAGDLPVKAVIEGPPPRNCPILLRQTSFKALDEYISFPLTGEKAGQGRHTARFGEIEQRGAALTPKGRALYDRILAEVRSEILPAADGSNAAQYMARLTHAFKDFPDTYRDMHDQELAYFKYSIGQGTPVAGSDDIGALLDCGALLISPVVYEDFLPVSAAGIFQSNLGDESVATAHAPSDQAAFEAALGRPVFDEFTLYEKIQDESRLACKARLGLV